MRKKKTKIESLKSIAYSLTVLSIEDIEQAKILIQGEPTFCKWQKMIFISWCDLSILLKQRRKNGKREI